MQICYHLVAVIIIIHPLVIDTVYLPIFPSSQTASHSPTRSIQPHLNKVIASDDGVSRLLLKLTLIRDGDDEARKGQELGIKGRMEW